MMENTHDIFLNVVLFIEVDSFYWVENCGFLEVADAKFDPEKTWGPPRQSGFSRWSSSAVDS